MPKFRICFSDHLPGEPGGGDWESTLSQDQLPPDVTFQGSLEEARNEAKRINIQDYYGDWRTWVERDDLRVVLLSGPSCVGKGPLVASIDTFFPDIAYSTVPVIKAKESRPKGPRPDEVTLWDNPRYFRTADEITKLARQYQYAPRYIVGDCRGLPQAIDLDEILGAEYDLVLVEAYHTLGSQLRGLTNALYGSDKISAFVSPVSEKEIEEWRSQGVDLGPKLQEIMFDKLKVRTKYQGENPDDPKISESNMKRAGDAYSELQRAHTYTHVLVNHDGEGHSNWNRTPEGRFTARSFGDALKVMEAFAEVLRTGNTQYAEHWKPDAI